MWFHERPGASWLIAADTFVLLASYLAAMGAEAVALETLHSGHDAEWRHLFVLWVLLAQFWIIGFAAALFERRRTVNRTGHPPTLRASQPGNTNRLRHGVWSADRQALEPRAREIAERILEAPHTVELDEIGAAEIGKLEALIEAIDSDLAERGLTNKRGDARSLVDLRLRASRRLAEWLGRGLPRPG